MSADVGPNIIEDGLVLALDASDPRSYAGSGTTWFDRSGNGYSGTLINGVGYNSENKGSLVFDGVNDYTDFGGISLAPSKITINTWIKIKTDLRFQHIVDSSSNGWHLAILNNNKPYFYNGFTYHQGTSALLTDNWYMITGVQGNTLDLYINGIISQSISSSRDVTTNNLNIGRWQSSPGREFSGNIANVQIYNRALSASEIAQNFNATRSRFNI